MSKQKIAIIGFGRFGELLTEILSPYADLFVVSSREIKGDNFKTIKYEELDIADVIIPSVPISNLKETLIKIKPFVKKGAVVMDVCSVKVYPCNWLKEIFSEEINIIGCHPMFGPDSYKEKKAEDLEVVFCPLRIDEEKYNLLKNIFSSIGFKIIETTPEDHDKQTAVSLALVHFIGRGLDKIKIDNQKITTVGFARLLQVRHNVVNDTDELFRDMNNFNPYAKEMRNKYIKSLQNINSMLD